MADLSDLNAAQTVKIVGANLSGQESSAVGATNIGALHVDAFGFSALYSFANSSNWMKLASYDRVEPSLDGADMILTYMEADSLLGRAILTYSDTASWTTRLERYIDDNDGSPLQDDDDTDLNLD